MGKESVGIARRFAVVGDPIEHSRSPLLHRCAYSALGISGATYEKIRVRSHEWEAFARDVLPTLEGLSITMPHKERAFALASQHDEFAYLGIANTLVPIAGEPGARTAWAEYNTDIDGIRRALSAAGAGSPRSAAILGSGATARSLAVALLSMGCTRFGLCARNPETKVRPLVDLLGEACEVEILDWDRPEAVFGFDVVGSALAIEGARACEDRLLAAAAGIRDTPGAIFDVLYFPDPTPMRRVHEALSVAAKASGEREPAFADGARMLAYQAARQVELMHGVERAPAELMYEAAFPELLGR